MGYRARPEDASEPCSRPKMIALGKMDILSTETRKAINFDSAFLFSEGRCVLLTMWAGGDGVDGVDFSSEKVKENFNPSR